MFFNDNAINKTETIIALAPFIDREQKRRTVKILQILHGHKSHWNVQNYYDKSFTSSPMTDHNQMD